MSLTPIETPLGDQPSEQRRAIPRAPRALVVNAHARSGEVAPERLRRALGAAGLKVDHLEALEDPTTVGETVAELVRAGMREIVVGGGDGTLSAVADVLAGAEVALGLLPLGTGNDFARSLGIPHSIESACAVLAVGTRRKVDLGRLNGRHFLNAASFGLTSAVTQRMSPAFKRRAGRFAYPIAAFSAALGHRPFQLTIETPEERRRIDALQVVVGNGRYHGAGRLIAPGASLADHRLDFYAIEAASSEREAQPVVGGRARNVWLLGRVALLLQRELHLLHPNVLHLRVRSMVLEASPAQEIDLDGELFGNTPARFELSPAALTVIAP